MDNHWKEIKQNASPELALIVDKDAKETLAAASAAPCKQAQKTVTLEQWAEVFYTNKKTRTILYPSTEYLREKGAAMNPPYNIVYRRIHFVNCVPPEYYWATNRVDRRRNGGSCIQRMTPETWDRITKEEAKRGDGHLLATPFLARPADRGICRCDVCTRHRERDENKAA
jgi:hypothetical protein